jgi:hypothetical protein
VDAADNDCTKTTTPPSCPCHAGAAAAPPAVHPPGAWPPGPSSGLAGWQFLRQMKGDLFGTLDAWRRAYGDMVHVRIWPEHQVVVTDPQLVRELLVDHPRAARGGPSRWAAGSCRRGRSSPCRCN